MSQQNWTERRYERERALDGDNRSAYQRDKARVLHSASFRRLQSKTQVMGIGVSDFTRTRLTHSLEVAQIGTGICSYLSIKYPDIAKEIQLDEHLIECVCLAHDIGHPPFGHGGEIALHQKMHAFGGFEGNGQTFRILTKLESYSESAGMNLSRRALLGVIKYPNFLNVLDEKKEKSSQLPINNQKVKSADWLPPKGLFNCDREVFDWVMASVSLEDKTKFMVYEQHNNKHAKTMHKSVDCSIMELADDIAYAVHDLEDAIVIGLVNQSSFHEEVTENILKIADTSLAKNIVNLEQALFSSTNHIRKNAIGKLVNYFITNIYLNQKHTFSEILLDYTALLPEEALYSLNLLKGFIFKYVIKKPELQLIEHKGQHILASLFDAFHNEPMRLLPLNTMERWKQAEGEELKARIIADYLSGMTDDYANRVFKNLFMPGQF
ncbi:anti-phage deoxyguanosine triphosphatase [Glaciecola sp. 2405UD65-10]|uniref:anti-phage deoxyguanosine triphosphatase n=1 Tax=Glaciecola sp. 2405UD65-10 TaxID=3397244 RepID=UPI003B5B47C1